MVLNSVSATGSYPPEAMKVERKLPRHKCMVIATSAGISDIVVKSLHSGIDRDLNGVTTIAEMHRRWRRDRHLRRLSGVRLQEFEMLDHRVGVEVAELPRHAYEQLLGLDAALERDLARALIGFDT